MKHVNIFYNFFLYIKMIKLSKTQRKTKKEKVKHIKIFPKKEMTKGKKAWERRQNLAEEERKDKHRKNPFEEKKQKLVECRRNYHLTDND